MAMNKPERDLEEALLAKLQDLKYEYRTDIRDRAALEANFREKFEALNRVTLTDGEFKRLLDEIVTPDVYDAARALRNREAFIRDDGTPLNYTLVNIKDWCKNTFEVINQLRINTDYSHHRYDVMLLINGVPVVQIELKSLGISPRRAMEQIVDYKNDPGNGYTKTLLCFVQLFIVSNRTDTWYFANNNVRHFAFDSDERFLPIYQFADDDNAKVTHLDDFADRFLVKCTLGHMISRYMVLIASEQKLMMMRPYQIYAVKAIVDCIDQNCGNGYIWHTTGSGKTLTSFKASTLLKTNESIHKCLFVVDRKDLDRQTREEFNRFQENCVEENTNTAALVRRLQSDDYADKVIVTTIQKLGLALDENSKHNKKSIAQGRSTFKQRLEQLRDKRMVFIFDECHRSQFGENHKAIKEFFPNSQLFGFTGTPIFPKNATVKQIEGDVATLRTTEDLFQKELHAYTITHAIEDRNVLRFHVDYYKPKDAAALKPGQTFTKQAVAQAILDKHDAATGGRRFNALLATASINDAIEYYEVFKKLHSESQAADPEFVPLKIAAVFSPPAEGNKDVKQIQEDLPQEKEDNRHDPEGKKAALKAIIADYNQRYGTNHDINKFDLYYQDVQQRIKDQQFPNRDLPRKGQEKIDITIVVDMLLTGFDAKFLNTLYVDKNLKHHSLIQAFSRTNRVLNATKPYGHILDFRDQQNSVDAAIAMFSGAQADRAREIWLVDKAPVVIDNYKQAVADLGDFMKSQGLEAKPDQVNNLMGDDARAQFINRFKEVQRLQTQLDQYTDITDEQREQIEQTLPKDELRAFRGVYLETAQRLKEQQGKPGGDGEPTNPDVDQLDFEFVLFASAVIDYDYIMKLIAKYSGQDPKKVKISRDQLIGLIQSDAKFLDEREEITEYVRSLTEGEALDEAAIRNGYEQFKARKQRTEIEELSQAHGLTTEALADFVDRILQRMIFDGEQLTDLMAPLDLGWRERRERELALMADLVPLLNKRAHGRDISGLDAYEHGGA
ncbi:type I restriction endonuclease subunit R [Aliiruegeria sabulilitoris]|uniref:type I restriction endonuclease subunit R n=1 Tax=Aliiruegeria sabulilitoris TaxID=1510458 RepID=UPI000B034D46|nr:type I restriction endonuclease subunit R [Aliiruegeria sabulilitoris]NDR55689.1 type I restriction endonuclease subunit R [Pseudoruegeria sp. M32A2M]